MHALLCVSSLKECVVQLQMYLYYSVMQISVCFLSIIMVKVCKCASISTSVSKH